MKKLNNKGFTLIELLAVIVILAIVMGISAQSVLTSINNSRKSSLYSAAQNMANTLNNWATEDAMTSEASQKMLGDSFVSSLSDGQWVCLGITAGTKFPTSTSTARNIVNIVNRNSSGTANTNLLTALNISSSDIVTYADGTKQPTLSSGKYTLTENNATVSNNHCSAIRYNTSTGGYEILLIAKKGGKYYVTTESSHYAFSRATGENKTITD